MSDNSNATPSMEQFLLLQNSVSEMKNLLSQFKSNANSIDDTNVTASANENNNLPGVSNTPVTRFSDNDEVLLYDVSNNVPMHIGENNRSGASTSGISQAVNQQVMNLIGTGEVDMHSHSQITFESMSRVIDNKVSDKIKNQIWANQFVDLSVLVDPKSDLSQGLKLVSGDGDTLCLTPNKISKKINGIGPWCDAFLVYLTVYTRKYPSSTPDLTTYLHNIKLLANRGGDYQYYDEEFRYMRQKNPSIGWKIDANLWLECRDLRGNSGRYNPKGRTQSNFRAQSNSGRFQHPYGYCYKYHTSGKCPNPNSCNYKHTCYVNNCGARHPASQCNKRGGNFNVKSTTTSGSKPNNNSS